MTPLLRDIFNYDFSQCSEAEQFRERFFARALSIADLRAVCNALCASHIVIGDKTIPAAHIIKGKSSDKPFMILAQLHGNEPAGLAGILAAMALADAGKLERDVIAVIGNPLAAQQYFEAYTQAPHTRQETRDAYRCGTAPDGSLYPDMNRIPVDFMSRAPSDHHTKRAQELYTLAQHVWGLVDIHSARGNMLCITDHKRDGDLKHSPIRAVLTELAEAISKHASATVTVQTFKTITFPLPNLVTQTGIEAGRHEAPESPFNASSYTLSLLYTLGLTPVTPLYTKENGVFERYSVQPRITYGDLTHEKIKTDDRVYMAKTCHALASVPARSDTVVVSKDDGSYAMQSVVEFSKHPAGKMEYAIYQYDEMEPIAKGEAVAVAIPSGTAFKTKENFSGIFLSKSATLYDKDPAVGPWPVTGDKIASTKFCYPCKVLDWRIDF